MLIVEDDTALSSVLKDKLNNEEFAVLTARDGEEGLAIALREHPDVILLDVRMPRMDGMTMMHKLRQDNWGRRASIIILSNYDTNDNLLHQIGADLPSYYLIKTNSPLESIVEKIQELLESKKEERESGEYVRS